MDPNAKQPEEPQVNQVPAQPIQPAMPNVSFVASPPHTKNKFKLIGIFGIGFILILILIGVLNYFNVLSLSSLYPSKLGWLPKASEVSTQTHKTQVNNPTPIPSLKYYTYAIKNLDELSYIADSKQYIVTGIYEKYNQRTIIVDTKDGVKYFTVDDSTILQNINVSNSTIASNSSTIGVGDSLSFADFIKQIPAGGFLQIFYQSQDNNLKVIKIYYLPNYRIIK